MEPRVIIRENWLTQKPHPAAMQFTWFLGFVLFAMSSLFFTGFLHADAWMAATPNQVFIQQEYWRLFTGLFAHANFGHLFSNSVLFLPLMYLLVAHYGFRFFPLIALLSGGLINFLVLKNLSPNSTLLGISGLVYWAGAAWLTLYVLVDRRESFRRRFSICLFLALMLFVPETYRPEVSYYSHFLGFSLGVVTAFGYYFVRRKTFEKAVVIELIYEPDLEFPAINE